MRLRCFVEIQVGHFNTVVPGKAWSELCEMFNDFLTNTVVFFIFSPRRRSHFSFEHLWNRLGICQKIYTTKFSDERILHTENALIETFFARDKQRKCIIISNLALFWLKLNSYYESLHLGVCKLAKYVRNCVVFWKNLHS